MQYKSNPRKMGTGGSMIENGPGDKKKAKALAKNNDGTMSKKSPEWFKRKKELIKSIEASDPNSPRAARQRQLLKNEMSLGYRKVTT